MDSPPSINCQCSAGSDIDMISQNSGGSHMCDKLSSILCVLQWNQYTFTVDWKQQNVNQLVSEIAEKENLPADAIRLTIDGQTHHPCDTKAVNKHAVVRIDLVQSLLGGKGGFGSLLRSMKPKAKGDENFDACRDLSGRRLRQVNNEQRLREHQ